MVRFFSKFLIFVFSLVIVQEAFCQNVESIIADTITFFPVSDIPDYEVKTNNKISETNAYISETSSVLKWTVALADLKKEIELNSEILDSIGIHTLNTSSLQKWDKKWMVLEKGLEAVYKPINDNTTKYIILYDELNHLYNLWAKTSLKINNLTVHNDIKNVAKDLTFQTKKLAKEVEKIEGDYLSLKSEYGELISEVSTYRILINEARDNIIKNLLIAEQPTLDKSFKTYLNDTVHVTKSHRLNNAYVVILKYLKKNPSYIYVAVFAFLMFLALLIVVQRRLRLKKILAIISISHGSKIILKRPVLFSLLLTWMVLSLFFNYPNEIRFLNQIIMLIPILILLRSFIDNYKAISVLLFSVFYIFRGIMFLLNNQHFIVRCGYLGLAIFLILLIWYILQSSNILNQFVKWLWFVRLLLFTILISMIFAVLFLIIGNVLLAIMIIKGAIGIPLTGVILYVSFEMLNSMLQILITIPVLQKSNIVFNYNSLLMSSIKKILGFVFILCWINISLNNLTVKKEVVEWFLKVYNHQFVIGSTSIGLNNVIAFILTLYISIWISRIILFVLEEEVYLRKNTGKGRSGIINLLLRYSIISLGFVYALAVAGIEMDNISILIGALSVGIGFGLQSIFNNLVSGIILAVERPVNVDDTIQIGELIGTVKVIGFRTSTVRTYDGAEVIVPNGELVSNQIINWTLSDRKRRLIINVGVSYDSDPDVVMEILKDIAENHTDVEKTPVPTPRFLGFGESSLDFQIRFWIGDYENGVSIETDILLKLYKKLKENGIEIPYPKRDIRIIRDVEE